MFTTEDGTSADILPPAVHNEKHEGPYKSNFACAVTINRPAAELYTFWRDFSNLPRFMQNIRSVTVRPDGVSHWIINAPKGEVEFDSRIVEDVPERRIAWAAEGEVDNVGIVEFKPAPTDRGTEVRVLISFNPPMGGAGRMIAGWMQKDPHIQAKRDLRRFKQLMETGEVATSPANQDAPAS